MSDVIDNSRPPLRPDWAARRVVHEVTAGGLIALWGFALAWYAAILGFGALLWRTPDPSGRAGAAGVLGVFAAAGLFLVYMSVIATRRRARFPSSVFELDNTPFAVGGCVSGVLVAPPATATAESFEFILDCFERHALSGSSRRVSLWREEASVPAAGLHRRDGNILVPVALMTPITARPTCAEVGQRVEWWLSVTARPPGLDYDASFECPVFAVEGAVRSPPQSFLPSRPVAAPEDAPRELPRPLSITPAQRAEQDRTQPAGSRIRLETGPDGVVIRYPNPSGIFPWAAGALLLVPAGALIGHPVGGLAVAVFVLGILLAGVVDHPRRVELRSDAVIVRRGLFGLRWDRRIARQDLSAVKHEVQSGGYHTLDLELRGGDRCNVGKYDQVRDATEAEWLKGEFERALRLGSRG